MSLSLRGTWHRNRSVCLNAISVSAWPNVDDVRRSMRPPARSVRATAIEAVEPVVKHRRRGNIMQRRIKGGAARRCKGIFPGSPFRVRRVPNASLVFLRIEPRAGAAERPGFIAPPNVGESPSRARGPDCSPLPPRALRACKRHRHERMAPAHPFQSTCWKARRIFPHVRQPHVHPRP